MCERLDKILSRCKSVGTCLIWMGAVNSDGYPRLYVDGNCNVKGHRLVYQLAKRKPPKGHVIRHMCDNPLCLNPAHLVSGTHAQNMKDRDSGGRHGAAKVTPRQVRRIRKMYAEGILQKQISEKFSISPKTVSSIINRSHWKHVI